MTRKTVKTTETRIYRLELGINLGAGTLPRTNPNLRLFPLQNALIDVTGGAGAEMPAWYTRFRPGDRMSFRLVDTTDLSRLEPPVPELAPSLVRFRFTERTAPHAAANPFTERSRDWRISGQSELRASPVYCVLPDQRLPTWDLLGTDEAGNEVTEVTFAGHDPLQLFRAFELVVAIELQEDFGRVDQFLFDPEMIVSETGNPNPPDDRAS